MSFYSHLKIAVISICLLLPEWATVCIPSLFPLQVCTHDKCVLLSRMHSSRQYVSMTPFHLSICHPAGLNYATKPLTVSKKRHLEKLFLIFPSSTSPSPLFVLLISSSSVSVLDCVVTEWKSAEIDTLTWTLIGNSELSAGRLGGKSCPNLSCLGDGRLDLGGVTQQIRVYWMCLHKCASWCVGVMWLNLCKLQLRFTNEGPFPHFSGAFKQSLRGCRLH